METGHLKEKAIKMTLETDSDSPTVYTITRRKGGGKYKIHTLFLYRWNSDLENILRQTDKKAHSSILQMPTKWTASRKSVTERRTNRSRSPLCCSRYLLYMKNYKDWASRNFLSVFESIPDRNTTQFSEKAHLWVLMFLLQFMKLTHGLPG